MDSFNVKLSENDLKRKKNVEDSENAQKNKMERRKNARANHSRA